MDNLKDIFIERAITIQVFVAHETTDDPNFGTTTKVLLNPFPIKALVLSQISSSKALWKMPGINTVGGESLLIEKVKRGIVEKSAKIVKDGVTYYGYRPANGTKLQIKEWDNEYLQILIYRDETA